MGKTEKAISSGLKTGSGIITTRPAKLTGVEIITNGVNDATVIVYNSQDATGAVLFKGTVPGVNNFGGVTYEIPVVAEKGLYLSLAGTGASAIVLFDHI